ncbi:hypothetical protein ACO1PF_00630 [Alkalibacterium sp. f15]|uniref:hypothetical protein n=1 Tax=Alkalibacterium sp. f15 TaxID=3414029 RepID=UPI003BF82C84
MRMNVVMYAYKDWLRKLNAGIHPKTAREEIEVEYLLNDNEKLALSIPMQRELEMRVQ